MARQDLGRPTGPHIQYTCDICHRPPTHLHPVLLCRNYYLYSLRTKFVFDTCLQGLNTSDRKIIIKELRQSAGNFYFSMFVQGSKTFYIGIRRYPAPETTSGTHLHQRQEEKYKINRQIEKVKNFFPLLCQKREVSNPVGGRGVLVGWRENEVCPSCQKPL